MSNMMNEPPENLSEEEINRLVDSNMTKDVYGLWTCLLCGYSTKVKSHLTEHVDSVHLKIRVWCPICEKAFVKRTYRMHKKMHEELT